jgi:uncharacterized protein (TIGR00369 family)
MEKAVLDLLERRRLDDAVLPGLGLTSNLLCCDEESRTIELSFRTAPWMSNPMGQVHGGVVAILMDNGMGVACHSLYGKPNPTISMTVNYQRPVPLSAAVNVRARVVSMGRTVSHTYAELFSPEAPDRILATATAVYSTKQ